MNSVHAVMTFADVIRPYRTSALVAGLGVSRNTVATWRRGGLPASFLLGAIADFVKMDASELLAIIAADSKRVAA